MSRDSKGQRVKSYKATVIHPELSRTEELTVVYFKADEGRFFIFAPPHYVEALGQPTLKDASIETYGSHPARISASTLSAVMDALESLTEKYKELLKHQNKKKVIEITLKYESKTHHKSYGRESGFRMNMQAPALHFNFKIMWDIAGTLYYYQEDDQVNLQRWSRADDKRLVDWTPEREAFFARMKGSLESLVDMLVVFILALEKNPDQAIASFLSKAPMLPPPAPAKDED